MFIATLDALEQDVFVFQKVLTADKKQKYLKITDVHEI